eukprot:TRINITY_DN4935_c0_g4_i1.p1 TRINITY_DN4935_c0_g4~~TRINITY_DN4935_c0_g4_i1.p1  ORF type:complete len:455 (+),score=74.09 TRINITY_DN4935_c0_g4_i1:65-1429(+)
MCAKTMKPLTLLSMLALAASVDPETYTEPEEIAYWAPLEGALPPFDAPRRPGLSREQFDSLILDGQVFVVPGLSDDWPMKTWDCDFFKNDPEFKNAAMNHQYAANSAKDARLGDDWQSDQTSSGAKNESAPQIAPFYWGIKDVQYEKRPGWKKAMLKRVAKNFRVPNFMHPTATAGSFGRTPEFWFGTGSAGAKAHMDSHVQATLSLQLAGTKRWRLMPLQKRRAPFLGMIYSDGQPYENPEGWKPLFDITLKPGDGLFFPPGMVHETKNIGDECTSSVTFQFDSPFAAHFYKKFFPRVRQTADIHEVWIIIREWARLGMKGDERGKGAPYAEARQAKELVDHFQKLDADQDGLVSLAELRGLGILGSHTGDAVAWHDEDRDGFVSLDEFREGFAFWSGITHQAVRRTKKEWRKFQLHGTIENLEDLPPQLAKEMRESSLAEEARILSQSRAEL